LGMPVAPHSTSSNTNWKPPLYYWR